MRLLKHPVLIGLLLAVTALAVYWPALTCGFTNYDDPEFVTSNAHVQGGITWENVVWAFSNQLAGNWHPLTVLSHALDWQLFGVHPGGHHLTSLLLHMANTVLLFVLLWRMTGALWRSAFVAALFALHPLHVESVAWVAERKDVLSTFFGLLTLLFYVRYAGKEEGRMQNEEMGVNRRGSPLVARHASLSYWWALLFFVLGLMSKPMLVTLPFVMLLLDWWPLGRVPGDKWQVAGKQPSASNIKLRSWSRLVIEKTPFFLLSAVASAVTVWTQSVADTMPPLSHFSFTARVGNALVSYARYLGKAVWPSDLAVFYPHPGQWPWLVVLGAGALVAGLCLITLRFGVRFPFLATGWFWFVGTLIPVIGLVQVGGQSMADRYTYLPLVGVFIAVTWSVAGECAQWRVPKTAISVAAVLALGACAGRTLGQVRYWRDGESLFRHALAVTQNNHIALYNLGAALLAQGKADQAVAQFHAALRITPHDAGILSDLGVALLNQGKTDEAITQFRAALQIKPFDAEILSNLGVAQTKQQQYDEAIANCETAVRMKPDYVAGRVNLANALAQAGRSDQAIEQYQWALRLKQDHFAAHNGLGNVLAMKGETDAAIRHFRAALRSQPDEPAAHENLGRALAAQGRLDEAVQHYTKALRLLPEGIALHKHLADALLARGRLAEAEAHYLAVVAAQPGNADAHYLLALVLAGQGDKAGSISHLHDAVRLAPDSVRSLNNLAWVRATDVDPDVRNGAEAVQLSERAARLTEFKNPAVLDTLAAAYAEDGRFAEAVATVQKALDLATAAGNEKLAVGIRRHLETYKSGRPHRE